MKACEKNEDKFYDDQAEIIFKQLNLGDDSESLLKNRKKWSAIDLIYQHPETGAKLYTGGQSAAANIKVLQENMIAAVINCTMEMNNFFEKLSPIEYTRLKVSTWEFTPGFRFSSPDDSPELKAREVLRYADSIVDVIDAYLENGKNVLIHCLAGAHRAGTVTVIYLMGKLRLPGFEAIVLAKRLRPIINPIARLKYLIDRIDGAVEYLNNEKLLQENSRWYRGAVFVEGENADFSNSS